MKLKQDETKITPCPIRGVLQRWICTLLSGVGFAQVKMYRKHGPQLMKRGNLSGHVCGKMNESKYSFQILVVRPDG
jgi:uncharacterized protein YgfB (UPF0149 family)